jgi:hypothetical protein
MQKTSKRSQPGNAVSSMQRLDLWRRFDLRAGKNEPIYERANVKRGGAEFSGAGFPHIPFRRRLRSIWPISDLSAAIRACYPRHIL